MNKEQEIQQIASAKVRDQVGSLVLELAHVSARLEVLTREVESLKVNGSSDSHKQMAK